LKAVLRDKSSPIPTTKIHFQRQLEKHQVALLISESFHRTTTIFFCIDTMDAFYHGHSCIKKKKPTKKKSKGLEKI